MIFFHNWTSPLKIKIGFETKIFSSFFEKEQRRAARTKPIATVSKELLFSQADAREFLCRKFEELIIPLEQEKFSGTRNLLGTTITVSTDISNFFFLKHFEDRYIIDEDENYAKVSSVSGSSISLASPISGTSTKFWTAMKCYANVVESKIKGGSLISSNISFENIKE